MSTRGSARTARALLALLALLGTQALSAEAQTTSSHADRKNRFSVEMPLGFSLRSDSEALGSYKSGEGITLSLSRIGYPALPAWRKNKREAFFTRIAEGAKESNEGVRRLTQKYERIEGVPTLTLRFSRKLAGKTELVTMRFLLFRKYVIVASAAVPSSAGRAERKRAPAFPTSLRPLGAR